MASENNNKSDSIISQDDIDSLFSSIDSEKESIGKDVSPKSEETGSQSAGDDLDFMSEEDLLDFDFDGEAFSEEESAQISQDNIDSLFDSKPLEKKEEIKEESSQVSQDDIDSLFDSKPLKKEPAKETLAKDNSNLNNNLGPQSQISPDEFDNLLKNPISDFLDEENELPKQENSENNKPKSANLDSDDNDYDFSSVSQGAVDALLEGKDYKAGLTGENFQSDFSNELESGEISQADIESILSEAKDLGVLDEENFISEENSALDDSELSEMISQSEIDNFFAGETSSQENKKEDDLKEEISLSEDQNSESDEDLKEDEFIPKDDWHLSQNEINGLLGADPSENSSENKKEDEFIPNENGFGIDQDELDSLLQSESKDEDELKNDESISQFETEKGSNLISQEFLDHLEDEFLKLNKGKNLDEDLDINDIFKDDDTSSDDILSDNEIDDLLGDTQEKDEADQSADELDFISQDDIDELLGTVAEDETGEDIAYESFEESQSEQESVLSQEELDRLLSQESEPKDANLDQAPVKEDHHIEKTVVLEKEDEPVSAEKKSGGKRKKIFIFSAAASFVILVSASVIMFFYSGKDVKPPVETAQKIEEPLSIPEVKEKPEEIVPKPVFVSTVILPEIIVPAPLNSSKYSYLEVDVSIDIKGENNLEVLNKNNVFFRDVMFKAIDEEFKRVSAKEGNDFERSELEAILFKTLSSYFKENDAVKGLVFTRFEPV